MKTRINVLGAAVALALAAPSFGATTWTLTGTPSAGVSSVGGYANTGGTSTTTNNANNGAAYTIQAGSLVSYSGGLGITNGDACTTAGCLGDYNDGVSPEHSIDNEQRYDMALITFSSSVKLTGVTIGWPTSGTYDTDVTVMAYTGAAPFVLSGAGSSFVGLTYNQLISKGWANVGNYSDLQQNTLKTINGSGLFSSYWLIGAYNPLANPSGGSVTGGIGSSTNTAAYDYVKLASVTGCVSGSIGCGTGGDNGAPEPGTLALVGAALLGTLGLRRRMHR